jgi:orotate phosphoribosyltransferase
MQQIIDDYFYQPATPETKVAEYVAIDDIHIQGIKEFMESNGITLLPIVTICKLQVSAS